MKQGFLSDYFSGVGTKRLSEVEISPTKSNQHEFNGISEFKSIFGTDKINFHAKYIYLHDDEEQIFTENGALTWYNAREGHATRTEYRLYYTLNSVLARAEKGDLVVICRKAEDELFIIVAPEGSTSERQVLWLFGLSEGGQGFVVKNLQEEKHEIGFSGRAILSELGIEAQETIPDYLEDLIKKFGSEFPKTIEFSNYARATVNKVSAIEAPDETLMMWLEQEEMLFRTLEKHILSDRLSHGFGKDGKDIDEFINFSLSVQNRRKARAGRAFENHLAFLFDQNGIEYSRGKKTERNNKPDFLFPNVKCYENKLISDSFLTMLGVKTTAKDRWRQVLTEADRIENKHLITLQPAISKNQTDEMKNQNLQLVVPKAIIDSYAPDQRSEIMKVSEFISLVKKRQFDLDIYMGI
jgi:hypothetical protein